MRKTLYLLVFTFLLGSLTLGTATSCSSSKSSKSSTAKRIKKQKKRQKRNPGDCPRIDCKLDIQHTAL